MEIMKTHNVLKARSRQLCAAMLGYLALTGAASATCLEQGPSHTGGISTESSSFINHCNSHVAFTFCIEGSDPNGLFECRRQRFGAGSVAPGRREAFSIMGAEGRPYRIHWVECESAVAYGSIPMRQRFTGQTIKAECN